MGRTVLEPLALFLSPFAVYALYLALRARYPLEVEHWTRGRVSIMTLLGLAAAVLGLVAHQRLRAPGPRRLHPGACRERRARSGTHRMTALPGLEDGKLKDLTLLSARPARASARRAQRRGRGDPARRRARCAISRSASRRSISTSRPPRRTDEVIRRARAAGFKVALTGVKHGTVTVIVDGRPIETTTLREDVETDGRWAKVAFGRDFAADARRRDFTINALSLERRRNGPRHGRRARGSRRGTGALHRRRGSAHSRGLSAHSAVLPLLGPIRRGRARPRGPRRRDPRARRPRAAVARAGARRTPEAPRRAARERGRADDGRERLPRADPRRRRLCEALQPPHRDRGRARRWRRPAPAAGRARRRDPGGRGAAARAAATRQRRGRPARDPPPRR